MGFGIKKEAGSNTTPSEIVNFDKLTPTTAGVVFDPNTPATEDILYVSSVDASTWIWNGTAYVTYTAPATASTEWYLNGTSIDAGSNKTAAISRDNSIYVSNNDSYFNGARIGRGKNNIITNTVVGTGNVGASISTGTANTFIGYNAGNANTTGGSNVYLGYASGLSNNGADNTFLGIASGRYIADGTPLTIVGTSVFIGANTRASLNNQSNQIVIGHSAIGKGSNTVNIGNTSITNTYVSGALTVNNSYTFPLTLSAPVSGISPILYFDGTTVNGDSNPIHLGYDIPNDTFYSGKITISSAGTQTAKFTNTATSSPTAGSGMEGFSDDGAAMVSGDRLGFYTLGGAKDGVHTTSNSLSLEGFATQNWTGTATGSKWVFSTTPNGSTTRAEGISIDQDKTVKISNAYTLPTTAPTSGQVLGYLGSGTTQWTTAAGGLTYFTEAQNTASPNATVNVDSLTAIASTTDADFAMIPKGAGAMLGAIPNNLPTGGNKRGQYAVDLQLKRVNADNVASGNYSGVLSGQGNTATNSQSVTIGGYLNTASGQYSSNLGGYASNVTGQSTAGGGHQVNIGGSNSFGWGGTITTTANNCAAFGSTHTLSQQYCFAGGGGHTLSNFHSTAFGDSNTGSGIANFMTGVQSHSFGVHMRQSIGGYQYTTKGDNQSSTLILSTRTTSATPKVLCSADSNFLTNANATNQLTLQNNNAMRVKGSIIAKQTGTTNVGAWDIDFVIVRGANAGTTVIVTSNVNLVTNASSWGTPTITADTTIGCPTITVTGVATTNIQWGCSIASMEVIY
jgi:hypothetical protein